MIMLSLLFLLQTSKLQDSAFYLLLSQPSLQALTRVISLLDKEMAEWPSSESGDGRR